MPASGAQAVLVFLGAMAAASAAVAADRIPLPSWSLPRAAAPPPCPRDADPAPQLASLSIEQLLCVEIGPRPLPALSAYPDTTGPGARPRPLSPPFLSRRSPAEAHAR